MAKKPAKATQPKKAPAKAPVKKSPAGGSKPVDAAPPKEEKEKRNNGAENPVKLPLVIRDPVHDLIRIDCPIAARLIQTEPFQRLRRIKQLGLASMVYPGAEHTRFNHSLGVYHLVQRAMDSIELNMKAREKEKYTGYFNGEQRLITGLAALLHDLGHGPFSHQFERFADAAFEGGDLEREEYDHEYWTREIILKSPDLRAAFAAEGREDLITEVVALLGGTHPPDYGYMKDLVSSQLDMDRLDYLIRDSHFTGCQYGKVDCEWILRSMIIANKEGVGRGKNKEPDVRVLAVEDLRGRNCIEQYLLGRHFMNIHVYYHKVIVSVESMIERILHRALELLRDNKALSRHRPNQEYHVLETYAKQSLGSVEDYLKLDDTVVMAWIIEWARGGSGDQILDDLSARLIRREHFVASSIPTRKEKDDEVARRVQITNEVFEESKFPAKYYKIDTERTSTAYKNRKDIHVLGQGAKYAVTLSSLPSVITEGGDVLQETVRYLLLPRPLRDEITRRLAS